ncbi:MAG: outer membrane protein assembly factor BamB family protein [Propionibacteriaceae bacterium]
MGGLITSTVLNNTDADLTTVWSLTPEDVLPGEYGYRFSETLDGTEGTDFLVTDSVWVALLMDRTTDAPAQLLGIDPDSGDPAWHLELPGAICADRPSADGTLACLSEQTDGWQITRVDLSTGEVAESVPAEVSEPRQVHLVADGLLVVGESEPSVYSQLTHLGADGAARWSTDLLELVGGETLFRESSTAEDVEEVTLDSSAAWTDVGDAVLLGHDSFVHIVPDTEQVQVHQGNYLAVVDDRFFYKTSPGSVGYDAAGTKVWHQPDVELVRSTEARPARSLLHLGTSERDLRSVDPATGELSDPIHTFDDSSGTLQLNGPPDETYVIRQEEVLRLSPDRGKVLWTAEVPDANSLSHGLVVGGATVVTTSPLTGLDPATGEELWTAEAESRDLSVVDGRLVAFDRNSLTVHDLP